ncbi:MAG TPA: molybdopterin converting factor subunit 1 [Stellaceae bacterium]|nr:molybdopterin converting factor subunit 1 [Stellaceae bacterium]
MKLLYFASLRQKIGTAEENLDPPGSVATVAQLVDWLKTRGANYADALNNPKIVRVAVNREYVPYDHRVTPGDEVALFPPVTGG